MVDAFATADDLATRLKRDFTDAEIDWINILLGDASTYLRDDVIGYQVYPQTQGTFMAWPDEDCNVPVPQYPVASVDSVTSAGEPVWYRLVDDHVHVGTRHQVAVTLTYGYTTPPESLKRWACVLVSQTLLPLEQQLGLTAGGLSSVQIDDFKAAWADAGESSGMTLSDRNIELIREQFGRPGAHVVQSR